MLPVAIISIKTRITLNKKPYYKNWVVCSKLWFSDIYEYLLPFGTFTITARKHYTWSVNIFALTYPQRIELANAETWQSIPQVTLFIETFSNFQLVYFPPCMKVHHLYDFCITDKGSLTQHQRLLHRKILRMISVGYEISDVLTMPKQLPLSATSVLTDIILTMDYSLHERNSVKYAMTPFLSFLFHSITLYCYSLTFATWSPRQLHTYLLINLKEKGRKNYSLFNISTLAVYLNLLPQTDHLVPCRHFRICVSKSFVLVSIYPYPEIIEVDFYLLHWNSQIELKIKLFSKILALSGIVFHTSFIKSWIFGVCGISFHFVQFEYSKATLWE